MRNLFIALMVLAFSACAVPKPQPDAFVNAEQSILLAEQAGAEQHSPVEMRFAREKLEEARKGMEYQQYDKSFFLIEQSEINSDLALEKTVTSKIRAEVTDQARSNEILREELQVNFGENFQ